MTHRLHAILATSVALASSALAQNPTAPYITRQNDVPLFGAGIPTSATAQKLIVGDISGHGAGDVIVKYANEQVCLFYAPGGLRLPLSFLPAGTAVTDIAIAAPNTPGGHERLVTTNGSGLTFWSMSKSGSCTSQAFGGAASAQWINASMLRNFDVDGDGDEDIVGIQSNLRTVVIGTNDGAGGYSTTTGPVFAQDLSDFTMANLDSDAEAEFVGLQPNGIVVRDSLNNVTMFARSAFNGAGYCMTTLHRAGMTDQIAWLTPDSVQPNAQTKLYLIDQASLEGPIMLGVTTPTFASAGDFNGDGLDDLLVANAGDSAGNLYRRLSGIPSFRTDIPVQPEPPLPPVPLYVSKVPYDVNWTATPAPEGLLVDLDGDDLPEVVGYSDDTKQLRVLMRDAPTKTSGLAFLGGACPSDDVAFVGANFDSSDLHPSGSNYVWTSGAGELQLIIDEAAWAAFSGPNPTVNAFEVHAYRQNVAGTASMTLSSAVNGWFVVRARQNNGLPYQKASDLYNPTTTNQPTLSLPDTVHIVNVKLRDGTGQDMPAIDWAINQRDFRFYVEIRACHFDEATQQITNRKRIYKYGFSGTPDTAQPNDTTTDGLITFSETQADYSLFGMNCFAALVAGTGGGVKVGGSVMMSSLPNFQNQPLVWPPVIKQGFQ
ncbi:MAG: VCBS repeat-containing protein [Planctomycetes bacterium]|nr:VCBS repeat-containing protein [Planctomycetota bacterium]